MQSACATRTFVATRISDSLSARIARDGHRSARVHSVFRSAINLTTAGELVTIAPDEAGGLPNGILFAGVADFRAQGIRAGMPVEIDGHTVRILDAGLVIRLVIRLADARPWSARMPVADGRRWPTRSTAVNDIARRVADGTDADGTDEGAATVGLLAMPVARERLDEVSRAVVRADRRAAAAAARPLIGMGPGLTPSGDDALAGMEAALHALGHPVAGFLAAALDDVMERTTAVSATLLGHAARGEFAERIHRLLAALLGKDDAALPGAVERAAAWGATSGMDGLIGVLAGLDAAAASGRRGLA